MIIMICLCLFVTLPHCQEFPTDFYPMGLVIPWGVLFLGPWGASRTLLLKSQPTPGGTQVLHPSWGCGRFARCNVWPLQRSREKTNLQQSRDLLGVGLQQICMNRFGGNMLIIRCSLGPPMGSKAFVLSRFFWAQPQTRNSYINLHWAWLNS